MYVLGVNGWIRGIHDSSAALFHNGRLVACAEEERFSRSKHAFNTLPHNAIAFCLKQAGITANEIDHIAVGWDLIALDRFYGIDTTHQEALQKIFPRSMFRRSRDPQLHLIPHHLAHAAGAFYSSGQTEAAIVVVDGSGEAESATLAHGTPSGVRIIEQYPLRSSLGIFYSALTMFVGLGMFQEGKTMGLAPYGTPDIRIPSLLNGPPKLARPDTLRDKEVLDAWGAYMAEVTGHQPNPRIWSHETESARFRGEPVMSSLYENLAASGQRALEVALLELVERCLKATGASSVCLSGGVALNCVANRLVALHPAVEQLYVQPPASDSGVSIGAGANVSALLGMAPQISPDHVYGGPGFSDSEILTGLKKYGLSYTEPTDLEGAVAQLLARDKIVARFSGRMEIGPRALGNRSILANPTRRDIHVRVNQIKLREQWRPLAPSVAQQLLPKVMEEPIISPYMLITTTVRESMRDSLAAIVHVDGSSRAQAVSEKINPGYWRLLTRFHAEAGVPAVMNTSFNVGSEPIVCTPVEAIRTFYGSEIDALILGSFLLTK